MKASNGPRYVVGCRRMVGDTQSYNSKYDSYSTSTASPCLVIIPLLLNMYIVQMFKPTVGVRYWLLNELYYMYVWYALVLVEHCSVWFRVC